MTHPNTPDHYWYRQGKDDGIQSEREAIVAWLRAEHEKRKQYDNHAACYARAIEAGEHKP